jgi:predicted enzyme related to lactoylglutathione lyase
MRDRARTIILAGLAACWLLAGTNITRAAEAAASTGEDNMAGMPQVTPGSGEHPLCWIEIKAPDTALSQDFYSKVFGWTFPYDMPEYPMFSVPAGIQGAFVPDEEARGQGAIPQIYCSDLQATLDRAVAAGATVAQQFQQKGDNYATAAIIDPAGTWYGLCNVAPQLPVPHIPTVFGDAPKPPAGSICSIELYGGDLVVTKKFFGEVFGWSTLDTMPQYLAFDAGAGISGVFQAHTAIVKTMPYIWVDDVKATLEAVEANGGKRDGEPMAMPGFGTFGYFTDPNGTHMGLLGPS